MGYQGVAGSQEVQELKYKDEVNSLLVAETAADLVILDGELTRVKGLVTFVRSENRAISLTHILQARSHPTEVFEHAINSATRLATESFPTPPVIHQQSAVPAYNSPRLKQQPHQQLVQYQPLEQQHKSMQHDQPHLEPAVRDPHRGSAPGILEDVPRDIVNVGSQPILAEQSREGGSHYCNLPLDPDVEIAIRRRQEVKEAEQQQVPNTSSSGHYVNHPNSSSECQRGDQYSEVRYDHEGKVHVGGARPSIPPDPLNLPEPIVQDEAGLERLQTTNPGGDYHTVSLITDARSDPVGFDGPSFDSLISMRSPENAAQYNKDAEDAWKVDPEPPKYPSAGSNGSWRSHHSNQNTSSGSEDIYGSDNNSAHGSKPPSMESHKQLYQPKDNVSVPRQDVTVSKSTVPTKRTAKTYDSDYDDYEVVEENLSAATRADYVSQVERNKLRTTNKHDSDYEDHDLVEQNLPADTRFEYVNQVERNKSRPSSDYKEYVKLPHGKKENSFAKTVATRAAAESDKHDYVNQATIDQQHTSVQRETTSQKRMNLQTSERHLTHQNDPVTQQISGSHSHSSYRDSNMQPANTNNSSKEHTYENDDAYVLSPQGNSSRGAEPSRRDVLKQSSNLNVTKKPVPSPRNSKTSATREPSTYPHLANTSFDIVGDANRSPPKQRSSPVGSALSSLESEVMFKSHTSPLSSLETTQLVVRSESSSLSSFVVVDMPSENKCSPAVTSIASHSKKNTSESFTRGQNDFSDPPPCNSPATIPRITQNILSGKSGPPSLSSLFSESPRPRSNALPAGMSRGKSLESPLASPTCPTKHEKMSQGTASNRPSISSVGPDQSRERSSSRSNLDINPEMRALSPRSSKDKQALSQKVVSRACSLSPEIDTPASVHGTWTCVYCTNIVFNDPSCDVCGNVKEMSTGTLV